MSFRALCLACALPFAAHAGATDVFALTGVPAGAHPTAMDDATPMRVVLTLKLRDEAGARAYAAAVSDPGSPAFGHYLTPAQFGNRFGPVIDGYLILRGIARSANIVVGPWRDSHAEISLSGTAGQFARLFRTHFVRFSTDRGDGYTVTAPPHLPAGFEGRVDAVVGLSSAAKLGLLPRHVTRRADVGTGANGSGYAPADLRTAYDIPAQAGAHGEVVALFEQDGYLQSDLTTFESTYGLANVPNQPVSVNGSSTGVTGNGAELEADLDLDMLIGANPALAQILVYEDNKDSFQTALLDAINQVAQDNKATVFSISYGQDERMQGAAAIHAENTALMQLQTQGITVFVSAGDSGAAGRTGRGLNAPDPGSQPLVTSVGGTRLTTNAGTQQYVSERVWNDLASGNGATGGGVSRYWTIPSYQLFNGTSVAVTNGGSATNRNVPDIAAVADPFTPVSVYSAHYGGFIGVGGTSASAPLWAAFATIYNGDRVAAGKARLGFLNPRLYALGEASFSNYHDVTKGSNGHYKAGPGYDDCTGWGSLDVAGQLNAFLQ